MIAETKGPKTQAGIMFGLEKLDHDADKGISCRAHVHDRLSRSC